MTNVLEFANSKNHNQCYNDLLKGVFEQLKDADNNSGSFSNSGSGSSTSTNVSGGGGGGGGGGSSNTTTMPLFVNLLNANVPVILTRLKQQMPQASHGEIECQKLMLNARKLRNMKNLTISEEFFTRMIFFTYFLDSTLEL